MALGAFLMRYFPFLNEELEDGRENDEELWNIINTRFLGSLLHIFLFPFRIYFLGTIVLV